MLLITITASATTHVVQRNETLSGIAKKYGVSVNALVTTNNLSNRNHVERGQKLTIPVSTDTTPSTVNATTHVVRKGESLSAIASKYSVPAGTLAKFNGITNPNSIAAGQVIRIPGTGQSTTSYTVQKGDLLEKIAQRFGVSTRSLVTLNHLPNANRIVVGQKLRIPGTGEVQYSGPSLPSSLRNQLDAMRVSPGKWDYVVLHHSATQMGSPEGMDAHHRRRHMQNGLAYHFVIGNGRGYEDGKIYIGNRWRNQINGGHLAIERLNAKSIGICLVGDFTQRGPTKKQMGSLVALTRYLMDRCDISKPHVQTHRQIHPHHTACPGNRFPVREYTDQL